MRIVRINQGKAISIALRALIVAILFYLIVLIFNHLPSQIAIASSIFICSVIPGIWFATKIFVIDIERNQLFTGFWAMGFQRGTKVSFNQIEFKIARRKTGKTVYRLKDNRQVIADHEYVLSVETEEKGNYYLLSHPERSRIQEKLESIKLKLELTAE